jgi:hypothetical protein
MPTSLHHLDWFQSRNARKSSGGAQPVRRGLRAEPHCDGIIGHSAALTTVLAQFAGRVSARQGVEDDHLNLLCMGGRTVGPAVAWDLVQTFLAAQCSRAEHHLRCLGKVAAVEAGKA